MGELKLHGMKAAFDEIMATAIKRQHEPQRIVGDLLNAEISEGGRHAIRRDVRTGAASERGKSGNGAGGRAELPGGRTARGHLRLLEADLKSVTDLPSWLGAQTLLPVRFC